MDKHAPFLDVELSGLVLECLSGSGGRTGSTQFFSRGSGSTNLERADTRGIVQFDDACSTLGRLRSIVYCLINFQNHLVMGKCRGVVSASRGHGEECGEGLNCSTRDIYYLFFI